MNGVFIDTGALLYRFLLRQADFRLTAKGNLKAEIYAPVPVDSPRRLILPGCGIKSAGQLSQTDIRLRRYSDTGEPGGHGLNPSTVTVQEFRYRAVRIVVQAVHAGAADSSIRQYGVPSFPDGGCPQIDSVQPSRKALVAQQIIGNVRHAVVRQHCVHHGSPYEASCKVAAIFFEAVLKRRNRFLPVRAKAKSKRQQICSLGINGQSPCRSKVFFQNCTADMRCKLFVCCLFRQLQRFGCFRHISRRGIIVHRGNKVDIRPPKCALGRSTIQSQPVPELESEIPEIFFSTGLILSAHAVYPIPHQRIVTTQRIGIPISGIKVLRQKCGNITPDCSGQAGEFIGEIDCNPPVISLLVSTQIPAELVVKRPGIHKPRCGGREYHGIAAPAKPLVPLRTVHGHIHEVGF